MREQVLDVAKLGEQFLGGLLADARATGNVVGAVAHQAQQVDHLRDIFQLIFLEHLGDAQRLIVATELGAIHKDVVRDQLAVVLVGRHHVDLESLKGGLLGDGPDHVVRLVAGNLEDRDAISLDDLLDDRHRLADRLGCLLALRLVSFESLVAEGRAGGIERDSDMCRLLPFQDILEAVDEAEDGRGIHPFRVDPGIFDERVVGTVNERVRVYEE